MEAQALFLSSWDMVKDLGTRAIRSSRQNQAESIGLHTFADVRTKVDLRNDSTFARRYVGNFGQFRPIGKATLYVFTSN